MGRGLSKLQKTILQHLDGLDYVLYEDLLVLIHPKFNPMEVLAESSYKNKGDTIQTFFSTLNSRKNGREDIWQSIKLNATVISGLPELFEAYEQHERRGPSTEAALSRAITRLEQRGIVERVIITDRDQNEVQIGRRRKGIRLTVKSR